MRWTFGHSILNAFCMSFDSFMSDLNFIFQKLNGDKVKRSWCPSSVYYQGFSRVTGLWNESVVDQSHKAGWLSWSFICAGIPSRLWCRWKSDCVSKAEDKQAGSEGFLLLLSRLPAFRGISVCLKVWNKVVCPPTSRSGSKSCVFLSQRPALQV